MLEFSIIKSNLENAMKLAFLSTETSENMISGHCLFEVKEDLLKVLATDKKTRSSKSIIPVDGNENIKFTADPRKILKLIKTIDLDTIKFGFDKENLTVKVYLSDDNESFISLPSFDPETYAPIEDEFSKAYDLKTISAGVFLGGMQFIKGFLLEKHPKFNNMFISKGILYGANGNNKAGAFYCSDLDGLDELTFPITTFPAITNMISGLDLQEIIISSSSNNIFVSAPNKDFIFAFTKVQLKMPKIPITIDEPDCDGWIINRPSLLKKLTRLQLSGIGASLDFNDEKINMETIMDRPSKETLNSKRLKGTEQKKCVTEMKALSSTLSQFGGDDISIFIKNKIILYSKGTLEFVEKNNTITRSFVSAAGVALSQV